MDDDKQRQIVEIRTAVLNLCNSSIETNENVVRLLAEIKKLNERLEKPKVF